MILGKKIIAVTPSGRRRFMSVLAAHVLRDHRRGLIDEWMIYNNAFNRADYDYTVELGTNLGPWVRVINEPHLPPERRNTGHISHSYAHMTEADAVYIRLDDDICYIDPNAITALATARIADTQSWLVYPTIFNNTRMSYMLQQAGTLPPTPVVQNLFLDPVAWRDAAWAEGIHRLIRPAIDTETLSRLALPARKFSNVAEPGVADRQFAAGRISVNSYAVWGRDVMRCRVPPDEEGYMSDIRPRQLNRTNAIAPGAAVVHFSYHCQLGLEEKGLLADYAQIAREQT